MAGIVISGASRGLGRAMAGEFFGRGHRVFAGIREGGSVPTGTEPVLLNVRDIDGVKIAIDTLAQTHAIDVVINNAGLYVGGPLSSVDQDDFKHVLDVNLLGAWRVTRAALPHMQAGGLIVMISSLSGLVGLPEDGPYAASKFALEGMSQSLAAEVASRGIRVLVIEPGGIATGFADNNNGDSPESMAAQIADIVENPGPDLRYPLGEAGRDVAQKLGLDTGSRGESVVKTITGCDWKPA